MNKHNVFVAVPVVARDCYQLAQERKITAEEAAKQMREERWMFYSWSDEGTEMYLPPKKGNK